MHLVAYLTHSVFVKYCLVPLLVACAIPVLTVLDCSIRTIRLVYFRSSADFEDLLSLVSAAIALPFKLIAYWATQSPSLFSVRHAKGEEQHLLISVMQMGLNHDFVREFHRQQEPFVPLALEKMTASDRILWEIGHRHNELGLVSAVSPNIKGFFRIAVLKKDQDLIDRLYGQNKHLIAHSFLPYCIEQGANSDLDRSTKKLYEDQAIALVDRLLPFRVEDLSELNKCLPLAINSGQAVLINRLFFCGCLHGFYSQTRDYIENIIKAAISGVRGYDSIITSVLSPGEVNSFASTRFFLECLDNPLYSTRLDIMGGLLRGIKQDHVYCSVFFSESLLRKIMEKRDPQLLKLLLEQGANPNQFILIEANLESFLEIACAQPKKRLELVEALRLKGANLETSFTGRLSGHTPLTYAASIQDCALVRLLSPYVNLAGCSTHPDYQGRTALQIAKQKRNSELITLLESAQRQYERFAESERRGGFEDFRGRNQWGFRERNQLADENGVGLSDVNKLINDCLKGSTTNPALQQVMDRLREVQKSGDLWKIFNEVLAAPQLPKEFRSLIAVVHPDKHPGEQLLANALTKAVNAIKDRLLPKK